jgi:hypothetical protein
MGGYRWSTPTCECAIMITVDIGGGLLSGQSKNLLIIDDYAQRERCRDLVAAYERGTASGRLNPRGTLVRDLYLSLVVANDPGLAGWARELRDSVGNLLSAYLGLYGLHPEYSSVVLSAP